MANRTLLKYCTFDLAGHTSLPPREGRQQLFVKQTWFWVGGICKCRCANDQGFPWVTPHPPLTGITADKFITTQRTFPKSRFHGFLNLTVSTSLSNVYMLCLNVFTKSNQSLTFDPFIIRLNYFYRWFKAFFAISGLG